MKKLILPSLLLALFSACKTDFDILAPYKETAIVYGLLNPDTTTQVIRINKAFLGEGNAYDMAKVRDSVNYKSGELTVSLQKTKQGVAVGNPIPLTEEYITTRSGLFSTEQMVFTTSQRIYQTNNLDTVYKLIIKNNKTGKEVTSETRLIGRTVVKSPGLYMKLVDTDGTYIPNSTITFTSAQNARQYKVVLRFYFNEIIGSDTTLKYVDLDLGNYQAEKAGLDLRAIFPGENFYTNIKAQVPYNPSAIRKPLLKNNKPYELQLRFTAITPEFYNYVEINKPSSGIVQDKPEYTNINGGLGFFSCRSTFSMDLTMDQYSMAKLLSGDITGDLNFKQ